MEWSPYLLHTCARCLSLITCNGLTDGSTIMPILPYLMDQICILPTLWWRSWGTNVIMVELFRLQTHMDWSSHPQHSYARCLKSFICYGLTNWSTILPILTHLLDQICILLKNRVTQLVPGYVVQMFSWWSDWGSRPTQNGFHTYTGYTYKLFDIIHMLWIDQWINHHAVNTTLFCPVFNVGSQPKLSDAAGLLMISWWSDWGFKPTTIFSHHLCIHMQVVCHHLYAMFWHTSFPFG